MITKNRFIFFIFHVDFTAHYLLITDNGREVKTRKALLVSPSAVFTCAWNSRVLLSDTTLYLLINRVSTNA